MKVCKVCEKPVYAKGLCRKHYYRMRYRTDENFRQRELQRGRENRRKYYQKKVKEDPEWNRKRQKEYRKKHPDKFYYIMARCYFRKLSSNQKQKLIKEVM